MLKVKIRAGYTFRKSNGELVKGEDIIEVDGPEDFRGQENKIEIISEPAPVKKNKPVKKRSMKSPVRNKAMQSAPEEKG